MVAELILIESVDGRITANLFDRDEGKARPGSGAARRLLDLYQVLGFRDLPASACSGG